VGERIRITARQPVIILDYATSGEKRRLEAPSSVFPDLRRGSKGPEPGERGLGPEDQTGVVLEVATVVEIREVVFSRLVGQSRLVYGRVIPSRSK
jgi:hypothetical protein